MNSTAQATQHEAHVPQQREGAPPRSYAAPHVDVYETKEIGRAHV